MGVPRRTIEDSDHVYANMLGLIHGRVYYNLLNLGQNWISNQRIPSLSFLLAVHGGTFCLTVLWLAKQHNNWGVRPLLLRLRRERA